MRFSNRRAAVNLPCLVLALLLLVPGCTVNQWAVQAKGRNFAAAAGTGGGHSSGHGRLRMALPW